MTAQEKEIRKLILEPEVCISNYDLKYIYEDDLNIARKKCGRGFTYIKNGKRITDSIERQRIKNLVIPPMWEQVYICDCSNGHLQAIGRDQKGRKQYLYHEQWQYLRNVTKFYKMYIFGKKLPKIRAQVDFDLRKKGWPKEKVIALVIRLMEETHIRIGNTQYEDHNNTYGLTTLRKKHIEILKNNIKIEFTGKRGKIHNITLKNKKLIKLINRCEELPGWTLFKFYDEEGTKIALQSNHVNTYLQDLCGTIFTAKDFRTWGASVSFCNGLLQTPSTTDEDTKNKNIIKAYDLAAKALGNTRTVCKTYYVHPVIAETYRNNKLHKHFDTIKKSQNQSTLSPTEMGLIALYKQYKPKLNN